MKECNVLGCGKPHYAKGYCLSHWRFDRLYGSPHSRKGFQGSGISDEIRFFRYVRKTNNCWFWMGAPGHDNYGRFRFRGKVMKANRVSWILHNGEIPKGLMVLHKCKGGGNANCVKPAHLALGTAKDNMRDMREAGRERKVAKKGEAHYKARITEDDVRAIRASAESPNAIAPIYGIKPDTVRRIRSRRIWKHVV